MIFLAPGIEGHWIWFHSGLDLTDSFWGKSRPNNMTGNTDDCGVMVLKGDSFWWEDISCLHELVDNKTAAPICQLAKISDCPGGYQFEGHCYVLMDVIKLPWKESELFCNYLGGHLASVHSGAQYYFLYDLVKSNSAEVFIWLGGSDTAVEVIKTFIFHLRMYYLL